MNKYGGIQMDDAHKDYDINQVHIYKWKHHVMTTWRIYGEKEDNTGRRSRRWVGVNKAA